MLPTEAWCKAHRVLTSSNEEEEDGHANHEPGNVRDLLAPAKYTKVQSSHKVLQLDSIVMTY